MKILHILLVVAVLGSLAGLGSYLLRQPREGAQVSPKMAREDPSADAVRAPAASIRAPATPIDSQAARPHRVGSEGADLSQVSVDQQGDQDYASYSPNELKLEALRINARLEGLEKLAQDDCFESGLYESQFVEGKAVRLSDFMDATKPQAVRMVPVKDDPRITEVQIATFDEERFPELVKLFKARQEIERLLQVKDQDDARPDLAR